MTWIHLGIVFSGALVGSGIPALVALRALHQNGRSEWRERLTVAVGLLQSGDPTQWRIGEDLLASLVESDRGSQEDRILARRILAHRVQGVAGSLPAENETLAVDVENDPDDTGSTQQSEGDQ